MQESDVRAAASRLVTFEKLAELYDVSVHTVRGWKLSGKLPGLRKIGGRYRVDLDEFEAATHVTTRGRGGVSIPRIASRPPRAVVAVG